MYAFVSFVVLFDKAKNVSVNTDFSLQTSVKNQIVIRYCYDMLDQWISITLYPYGRLRSGASVNKLSWQQNSIQLKLQRIFFTGLKSQFPLCWSLQ